MFDELAQPVRHEQNDVPRFLQFVDVVEELPRFGIGQRRVRLVEQEDMGGILSDKGAADLGKLLHHQAARAQFDVGKTA
jgi:hypothetical protein